MRTPFAEALIEAREAAGLTQRQLAERVGMSQQAIARWELGTSEPRPGALLKLRAELGEIMKRSNARAALPVTPADENRNATVVTRTGDAYQLDFVTDRIAAKIVSAEASFQAALWELSSARLGAGDNRDYVLVIVSPRPPLPARAEARLRLEAGLHHIAVAIVPDRMAAMMTLEDFDTET